MKTNTRDLREAERLIDTLVDGLPEALQTLNDLQGVPLPESVKLCSPLHVTAAKLLRGIQAYEAWASNQGPWASR